MKVDEEDPMLTPNDFCTSWSVMCMHASTMRKNLHAHLYIWQLFFNSAEFRGDEENQGCSRGSNDFHTSEVKFL